MDITQENRVKVIALLAQGICPLCDKSRLEILRHISRSHGITAKEIKDTLLLPRNFSFIPEEQSEKYRQNAIKNDFKSKFIPGRTVKPDQITREKMSAKLKARHQSHPEQLQKLHESAQKVRNEAVKKSNETNRKAVVRVSPDGKAKIYKSMADAGRDSNIDPSNVSRCITVKNRIDSHGNRWILLEDYQQQYGRKNTND
jgi:hypothetical protein